MRIFKMDKSIYDLIYKTNTTIEQDRLLMYRSLLESVAIKGGDTILLEQSILSGMTVIKLIDTLAQNKIRFTYVG